jgi:Type II secretion system (T2SS), protein M
MTGRDRIVLIVVVALALLAVGWIAVVSPERKQAAKLQGEISSAQTQLASAESQLSDAKSAQARYSAEYAAIVRLGKAVPPGREVPSLLYELAQASGNKHVELASIVSGAAGAASSASGGASAASPVVGFTQMPFTFVFNGTYNDLYSLFKQLDHSAVRTASGRVSVSGRLLTIQSLKLAPLSASGEPGAKNGDNQMLSGTISATAYVLPQSQSLTGGASASAPAGAPVAPTSSGASSPTAPAIARVVP